MVAQAGDQSHGLAVAEGDVIEDAADGLVEPGEGRAVGEHFGSRDDEPGLAWRRAGRDKVDRLAQRNRQTRDVQRL
jgi:hypothetical protein